MTPVERTKIQDAGSQTYRDDVSIPTTSHTTTQPYLPHGNTNQGKFFFFIETYYAIKN